MNFASRKCSLVCRDVKSDGFGALSPPKSKELSGGELIVLSC